MAPALSEVGAVIVGAAAPNTIELELKLRPLNVGAILPELITTLLIKVEPRSTFIVAKVVPPPVVLFIVTT